MKFSSMISGAKPGGWRLVFILPAFWDLSGCTGTPGLTAVISVDAEAPSITEKQGKEQLRDFSSAQLAEMKSLRERHTRELKDLTQRLKVSLAEWERKSTQETKAFIRDHRGQGKEIRVYVREGQVKHDVLRKSMNEDKRKLRDDQENQRRALKATQDNNLQIFKAYLIQGKRPPDSIWPAKANMPASSAPASASAP